MATPPPGVQPGTEVLTDADERVSTRQLKGIDVALDWCKQQMLLAAALLAFSVAFSPGVPYAQESRALASLVGIAWVLLFGSIIAGLIVLGRAVAELNERNAQRPLPAIVDGIRRSALLQFTMFVLGVALLLLALIFPLLGSGPAV